MAGNLPLARQARAPRLGELGLGFQLLPGALLRPELRPVAVELTCSIRRAGRPARGRAADLRLGAGQVARGGTGPRLYPCMSSRFDYAKSFTLLSQLRVQRLRL